MSSLLMSALHQNPTRPGPASRPWAWCMARHEVSTLTATVEPRWLLVGTGSVWVTQVNTMTPGKVPEDIWLAAGQSLRLPARSTWLLEAWLPAELSLAVRGVAQAQPATVGWRAWLVWARRFF
jgi:hypothetical protein